MKWLEKILFKDELNKFKVQSLYRMKTAAIIGMVVLVVLYIIQLTGKTGYAVTKRIYPSDTATVKVDNVYYELNGLLPIAQKNVLDKVLFSVGEQKSTSAPVICFADVIAILLLLFFLHRFISKTIRYGPFDKAAILYLKRSVLICFAMFCIKAVLIRVLDYRFDAVYGDKYQVNWEVYFGQNWLYVMVVYSFVLNIFNYGKKLQEENDLTI